MKYTIDKLSESKVVRASIEGTLKPLERKEVHLSAVKALKENGYCRLLIDVCSSRVSSNYGAEDSLNMINYMNENKMPENTRMAFLSDDTEVQHKAFITFAKFIGDVEIERFTHYDDALRWLCRE